MALGSNLQMIEYEPIDYVIIISRPHLDAVRMSRRNMADYVHFLAIDLRALQLVHEPLQLADRIRGVDQEPPIFVVTIIHIDGENPEARANQDRIEGAATDGVGHPGWQPNSPVLVEFVVQPRYIVLFRHKGWWEAKTSGNGYRILLESIILERIRKYVKYATVCTLLVFLFSFHLNTFCKK